MAFFKNILNRLARGGGEHVAEGAAGGEEASTASAHLAIFGKHPAWDDHIDDIGLDSQRLIDVKRTFYLQGVGANLDAGTWEKLEPEQRVERFNHFFCWRADGSEVIGRALASTDGKGRGRFPLVACIHCIGLTPQRVAAEVAPLLEDVMQRCRTAQSQDAVRQVLAESRERLDRLVQAPGRAVPAAGGAALAGGGALEPASDRAPAGGGSLAHPGAAAAPTLQDLVNCPQLRGDPPRLHSVLFQIEREMRAFIADSSQRSFAKMNNAAHLRVPTCDASPAQSARLWIDLLCTRIDPYAPVLAVVAADYGWVDLLVGEPRGRDFFCLLASRKMLPYTTDIPFNMDAAFHARASQWLADFTPAPAAEAY